MPKTDTLNKPSDYPEKKSIGLTKEQNGLLNQASFIRGKSQTFLMREYIEAGAKADIDAADIVECIKPEKD